MHRSRIPLPALLVLLAFAACKKEDDTPPAIGILAPANGSAHVAASAMAVQVSASDDGGLASVTALLTDDLLGTTVSSASATLTGNSDTRSFNMVCGDRYTATGAYTLSLTAYDKSGNSSRATIALQVSETPRVLYRTVFTVYPPSVGIYQLFSIDSAGFSDAGPYLGDSVADLLVENRHQRAVVALRDDGSVRAYHPEDFQADFVYQPFPRQHALNGIRSAGVNGYLIAYETPPYLRQLDRNGLWQNDWDGLVYPVRNAYMDASQLYLSVHGLFDQPIKLDRYNYTGENLTNARPLSCDLLYLARSGDALIGAGPSGNQTRIYRLGLPSLVVLDSATIGSPYIGGANGGDHHFILTQSGLARLDLPNFSLNANFVTGNYTAVGFEPSRGQVWLGGSGALEVYDLNGQLVTSHITSFGEVRHIGFHLNK